MTNIPLGKSTGYPVRYAPELLAPVSRRDAREAIGVGDPLPFTGVDIWNAWELTWLEPEGKPAVAVAEFRVPADSPNIVESKSLKLYLNSFAMTAFASADELRSTIAKDLADVTGSKVGVSVESCDQPTTRVATLPGSSLDGLRATFDSASVDPSKLITVGDEVIEETLHTHLLRSLCPVTAQPDLGSVMFRYRGRRIDTAGLLQYVVSFRRHSDFHEACVERMFVDLRDRCECESLAVHARYTRRGGIDINPFRSSSDERAENLRLWRQ